MWFWVGWGYGLGQSGIIFGVGILLWLGGVRCERLGNFWLRVKCRADVLGMWLRRLFLLWDSVCGYCGGCLAGLRSIIYRGGGGNWSWYLGIVLRGR